MARTVEAKIDPQQFADVQQHNVTLTTQVEGLQRERDTLLGEQRTLGEGLARRDRELAGMQRRELTLNGSIRELQRERDTLLGEQRTLGEGLARRDRELAQLTSMLDERDGVLGLLEMDRNRYFAIVQSRLWRIAMWLRAAFLPWREKPASQAELARVVKESRYFDTDWYLETYPEVKNASTSPEEHYVRCGVREIRDPGPDFSTIGYLLEYPDVAAVGINPLVHYERAGAEEGRNTGREYSPQHYSMEVAREKAASALSS